MTPEEIESRREGGPSVSGVGRRGEVERESDGWYTIYESML